MFIYISDVTYKTILKFMQIQLLSEHDILKKYNYTPTITKKQKENK